MIGRVAIDVTTAVTQRAGVGRYTRELVAALHHLANGPELQPFVVAPRCVYALSGCPPPRMWRRSIRSWRLEMLARQVFTLPRHGPWDGADVYHAPDVMYPPVYGMPVVTTVHDLSYVVYPQFHTRLNGAYLRQATPRAVRNARFVIVDSESTRNDLSERIGVPLDKMRVVYCGVAAPFASAPSRAHIASVRERYGLESDFILSVGTLEPRKNLAAVVQAYRKLREQRRDLPVLALVGGGGWGMDGMRLLGDDGAVRRLGFVPDDDLAALYASCRLFVYVSLYEGWGLPVAEAMALGAPTITSCVSSLPEVAGDAALQVDPRNIEEMTAVMDQALHDSDLQRRLRAAGPERARIFTLQRWASDTLRVYREAAGR